MLIKTARSVSKHTALRIVHNLELSDEGCYTVYLPAKTPNLSKFLPQQDPWKSRVEQIMPHIENSETGVALFLTQNKTIVIMPPFPMYNNVKTPGILSEPLRILFGMDTMVAVILIRLGRYAVAVLRGDDLISTKTATRHVKNRHRAGGQSQKRFERSRERLIRELYDKTCQVARDVITPHIQEVEYVLLGGERHTVNSFTKRCRFLQELSNKTLTRRLAVGQPNQKSLKSINREVWVAQVMTFESCSS